MALLTTTPRIPQIGVRPGASVSGYYLWHPEAHYFGIGRIGRDQLEDYARRKGWPLETTARWMAPNLADE